MRTSFYSSPDGEFILKIVLDNDVAHLQTGIYSEDYFEDYTEKKLNQFRDLATSYAQLLKDQQGYFNSEHIMRYMRFKSFCFGNQRLLDKKDRFLVNLLERVCLAI